METFKSICCFCGVGCGVLVTTAGGRVTDVRGDPSHPANFGRLCTKGASLHLTAGLEGRALYPELRRRRGEARQRAAVEALAEGWAENPPAGPVLVAGSTGSRATTVGRRGPEGRMGPLEAGQPVSWPGRGRDRSVWLRSDHTYESSESLDG